MARYPPKLGTSDRIHVYNSNVILLVYFARGMQNHTHISSLNAHLAMSYGPSLWSCVVSRLLPLHGLIWSMRLQVVGKESALWPLLKSYVWQVQSTLFGGKETTESLKERRRILLPFWKWLSTRLGAGSLPSPSPGTLFLVSGNLECKFCRWGVSHAKIWRVGICLFEVSHNVFVSLNHDSMSLHPLGLGLVMFLKPTS